MRNRNYQVIISLIIISLIAISLTSCSKKRTEIVAKIGDESIFLYEFENSFLKLTQYPDSLKFKNLEQKEDMLNQYINLRLKAKDAISKGMLDSPDIKKEMEDFRVSLLTNLYEDRSIVDPYVKELYERRKYELRVSHIMVNLSTTPSPEDSIKAFKKIEEIYSRLEKNEDFGKLASELSEEAGAKRSGGDVYYITGGKVYQEIEDAVYELKVGDYSKKPVRTPMGLHIVKVTDKKPRVEKIKVSHILIQDVMDSTGKITDSLGTIERAKNALERIRKGEPFEKVAQEVSQDPGSKDRGGDIGYAERRRMVIPFDSTAFSLKLNQISDLVRTNYGLHIIKVTDIVEIQPMERIYESLKTEYKRSEMFRRAYLEYMEKFRQKSNFQINQTTVNLIKSKLDSTKTFFSFNWDSLFTPQEVTLIAATFDGGDVKISDLIKHIKTNNLISGNAANLKNIVSLIEESANHSIAFAVAVKENLEKDNEYIDLFNEFKFGLLKHKADQLEVSSKLKISEEEITKYYDNNKQKFSYKDGDTLRFRTLDEVRSEISTEIQTNKQKDLDKNYVEALRAKYPVEIYDKVLEKAFKEN